MAADDLQHLISQRQAEAAAQENAAREEQWRRQEQEERRQTDLYNFKLSVPSWVMTAANHWNLQLRGVAELIVGSSPRGDQVRLECRRTGGKAKHASGSITFGLDGNRQIVARSTVSIDAPMTAPLDNASFDFFNIIVNAFVGEMMQA